MRSACAAATRMKAELWATSSKEQGAVVDQLFRRVAALAFEEVMLRRRGEPVVQLGLVSECKPCNSLHTAVAESNSSSQRYRPARVSMRPKSVTLAPHCTANNDKLIISGCQVPTLPKCIQES